MITFAFLTCRVQSGLDWFADALEWQARDLGFRLRDAELVVVDALLWSAPQRRAEIVDIVAGRVPVVHVPPKPSPWQGPQRLTKSEYAAHASARNTVFCHARGDHVITIDELSVPEPGWLHFQLEGVRERRVVASTYEKRNELEVVDGRLVSSRPGTRDSREAEPGYASGGWHYGGSLGCPLEVALTINGYEERNDALGLEDCDFGVRAERAGHRTWFEPRAKVVQAEDLKLGQPQIAYHRVEPLKEDFWQIRPLEPDRVWTAGNAYNLRELRETLRAGGDYPAPQWFPEDHWALKFRGQL